MLLLTHHAGAGICLKVCQLSPVSQKLQLSLVIDLVAQHHQTGVFVLLEPYRCLFILLLIANKIYNFF